MLGKTSSMGNVGKGILCWNLYTPWKIHVEPEFFTCFCQREIIFQPTHDFWASTCAAKKAQPYFPLYWLFDRDPYYGSQFL